jgi:hypothetical protein
MPFDPRISLAAQAPAFADPMDMYKDYMSLRDLVDQRRVRDLQVRRLELQEQEAQESQVEKQGLRDLFRTNATPTAADVYKVAPITGQPVVKGLYDASKAQFESRKSQADFAESERQRGRKVQQEMVDQMRSLLELPEPARPAAYQKMLQSNIANKYLPAEAADQPMPTPQEIRQQYAQFHGAIALQDLDDKIAKSQREKEEEARKEALFGPAYAKAQADKEAAQQKVLGLTPETPHERAVREQQARPVPGRDVPLPADVEAQQTRLREASRSALSGPVAGYGSQTSAATGEEFLKTLDPGIQRLVTGTVRGDLTLPPANSRAPGAQELRRAVMQYDPTFNEQRAQIRKAFTTGKEGQNIGAINTAVVHLGRLADTADALKNGSFTPGNEMYQYFKDKFGSATTTNFGLLKDAVAGEMAAALKGSATDIEIANMKQSIRASNSPEQMQGVVKEGMGILSDKAKTYDDRYHRDNPDDTSWSPILPTAKESLNRFGVPYTGSARGAEAPAQAPKDPPIGTVKNGWFYKGGGAGKKENWIRMGK